MEKLFNIFLLSEDNILYCNDSDMSYSWKFNNREEALEFARYLFLAFGYTE